MPPAVRCPACGTHVVVESDGSLRCLLTKEQGQVTSVDWEQLLADVDFAYEWLRKSRQYVLKAQRHFKAMAERLPPFKGERWSS